MKSSAIAMLGLSFMCANTYAAPMQATTTPAAQTSMQSTNQAPTQELSLAEKNKQEGEAFLAMNKLKPDVVTLPDGLQYKVINEGTGAQPKSGDVVVVDYAGTFINGEEFDSSYKRGQPIGFPVDGVIAGWTEALKLMKAGATWMLYIPSKLAYG